MRARISRPSGTCTIPARTIACGAQPERSRPSNTTCPVAGTRPEIAASVLDFPAPFAPMSAVTAPPSAVNEMPCTASTAP